MNHYWQMTGLQARSSRWFSVALALLLITSLLSPAGYAGTAPVLAGMSLQGPSLVQNGGDGRFASGPCSNFKVPAAFREGRDVECGYLTVPTEHGAPSNGTIQLGVVIIKSTNPNPPQDPIVMLQGGPGGSTINDYAQGIPLQGQRLRANRDIILFDQRGTLYTKPSLVCPEYLDMTIKYLNVKLTPEESDQKALEALSACRARLQNERIDLSAYDSVENAADIESLRMALGFDRINLYGVSYGTLLALHYLRQFPQGARSVILDSTVPPQVNFILDAPRSEDRSFEALFAACAADAQCNASYPNLRKVFFDLVDRLNKSPVHVQLIDPYSGDNKTYPALLDGDSLLNAVFQMMYSTEIIPLLPKTIYDVRDGNYSFLERILSLIVFDRSISMGMYYSVMCSEEAEVNPKDYNLSGLPPEIAESERDSVASFIKTCKMWNVSALNAQADQPVSSNVPTLILSGAFDPITPPAYGQAAAQTLSNSYFFLFPNGGHGEALTGPCPDSVITAFLNDPNQKPDASCINQLGGPKFITRGSLVHLPALIQLLNLKGAALPEMILYVLGLLFLLSALLVYPIVWMVRLFRGDRRPAADYPPAGLPRDYAAGGIYAPSPEPVFPPRMRPFLYRIAPWTAALTAVLLLVFTAVLFATVVNMIMKNDTLIFMGLPASSRPLFVLPLLSALLALILLATTFVAWAQRAGSVSGRTYLTLLTLSALTCVAVLALWGMVTAVLV